MTTIAATPDALAELARTKATAENELRKMRRINHAFKAGRRAFLRHGFTADDYEKFADAIARNPDYGPVPFSPRLIVAKRIQIERIGKQLATGKRLLTPAIAG